MTYSNIDFFNRTIFIDRGKTKNARRTLSMSREVFELLKKRRQSHENDYWIFPSPRKLGSVRKAHDRVCDKIGLRRVIDLYNLYNLRHYAEFWTMPNTAAIHAFWAHLYTSDSA